MSVKCLKCGECCTHITLRLKGLTEDEKTWMEYHGFKIIGDYVDIPIRCKHLMKNNLCAIYENRPQVCRDGGCWKGMSPFSTGEAERKRDRMAHGSEFL